MNWFIRPQIVNVSKTMLDEYDGYCEHVKVGTRAYVVGEQDSFGPVTRFLRCPECHKAAVEEEDNEEYVCHDCHCTHAKKDMIVWKAFDFQHTAGDKELYICNTCKDQEPHLTREKDDLHFRNKEIDQWLDNDWE